MKILTGSRALLFTIILSLSVASDAFATTGVLTGKMAPWQQLVGKWDCRLRMYATENRPYIQEGLIRNEGSVVSGNVFHLHGMAPFMELDAYYGYSKTAGGWWETQADSQGYATLLRSTDGVVFDQVSDASSSVDKDGTRYQETYTFNKDGTFSQVTKTWQGGSWKQDSEMACHTNR